MGIFFSFKLHNTRRSELDDGNRERTSGVMYSLRNLGTKTREIREDKERERKKIYGHCGIT
jgi:hypothetical protein